MRVLRVELQERDRSLTWSPCVFAVELDMGDRRKGKMKDNFFSFFGLRN